MWKKWFPWRFFLRQMAQKQGFLDPIALLAKFTRLAQPAEVAAPVELIRLATVLHARGLLNAQAIQHNLDWIWPFWVVRQFNPKDISFIPRAFSLTHINLTHRNWTAVGIPDFMEYSLVDPNGLLTPFYDSWSLDAWVINEEGEDLLPSRIPIVAQTYEFEGGNLSVVTLATHGRTSLVSRIFMEMRDGEPYCVMSLAAFSATKASLVVSLRPFNPEGVSEVEQVSVLEGKRGWQVNKKETIHFSELPDGQYFSEYHEGDVYQKINLARSYLGAQPIASELKCKAGMATAAAAFHIAADGNRKIEVQIPLRPKNPTKNQFVLQNNGEAVQKWQSALEGHANLQVQDKKTQYLYEAALRTVVLHTPEIEVFPGPYTYKHFWFRDAAFILHAMLAVNLTTRVEKILDHFPKRQTLTGYFRSQEGEWDSNGQVLWIFRRFCELTGISPKESWEESIRKGVHWMQRKRLPETLLEPHAGLFPAGFSAEHLGPNDYYFWDDFWGVEGFRSGAYLMKRYGKEEEARHFSEEGNRFLGCIEKSLLKATERLNLLAMPASPYRRLDTGSIGSLGVGYPLDLWRPDDARVMKTVDYLLEHYFINGGFFHNMSHSGINPYLTLTVAQILLRNQDSRYADVVRNLQNLASPTGQWPEAVHPRTMGGCMGDGQHVWAAAEWILMVRNCFVREEGGKLIFCSGILPEWIAGPGEIFFGKTLTPYGPVRVSLQREDSGVRVQWEAEWRANVPTIEIRLPGYQPKNAQKGESSVKLEKSS